jgi:hypothetical protein
MLPARRAASAMAGLDADQASFYRREQAIHFLDRNGQSRHAGGLKLHPLATSADEFGSLLGEGRTGGGNDVGAQIADVGDPRRIGLIAAILLWGDDTSRAQLADFLRCYVEVFGEFGWS